MRWTSALMAGGQSHGFSVGALCVASVGAVRLLCKVVCERLLSHRIAFVGDGVGQGLAAVCGLHLHPLLLAVDLDLGLGVDCADGLGDCFFAMAAAHAFHVEGVFQGVSCVKWTRGAILYLDPDAVGGSMLVAWTQKRRAQQRRCWTWALVA